MTYKQATVWICDHCGHNEYNSGDYIPSGWVTIRISNDRIDLTNTSDRSLCHNCVSIPVVRILEAIIETA